MCYSAMVEEGYLKYVRRFGAVISIAEYFRLYVRRARGERVKTTKAMDADFANASSGVEAQIRELIAAHDAAQASRLETELFTQKQRLNKAARVLAVKPTNKAREDQRIASAKIERAMARLEDLRRTASLPRDSRIFPGVHASVLAVEDGRKVVMPMRYQCRPAGKPASCDAKYPGTYNARRDNLEGYWKGQFGVSHGLVVARRFYDNVERYGRNAVLEFVPRDGSDMFIACLWSRWTDPTGVLPDLVSFAAITDAPEPEVAAAGHDRTIINIKPEHVDAWLAPDPSNLQAMYAILDDRRHPYYEHRLAA